MPALRLWMSPVGKAYLTAAAVAADAKRVHLDGCETRLLLPTLYGPYAQQDCNRTIGDALAIDNPDDAAAVRAAIEAEGVPCDGWSVPRGGVDLSQAYDEGYAHGRTAAHFDYFVLNFEEWSRTEDAAGEQFWLHPQLAEYVGKFLAAFWAALDDAGRAAALDGNVWITWVTNSMLTNASDPVKVAWLDGTNGDALEAYVPGDVNLDPANSLRIFADMLARLGRPGRPAIVALSQGDLPALCQQYADPEHGVQVWTLEGAAAQAWPAPQPVVLPVVLPARETPDDFPYADWRQSAIAYRGALDQMGQDLAAEKQVHAADVATLTAQVASLTQQLASTPSTDTWKAVVATKETAMQQAVELLKAAL